jgi:hypothetical protein
LRQLSCQHHSQWENHMAQFHGCIAAVAIVAGLFGGGIAQAQPERGRGIGVGGAIGLAELEAVQKEIGLEGNALAKYEKVIGSFQDEMKAEIEKAGAIQNLSQEERKALNEKMIGVMQKLQERYVPKLKEALTGAQIERLQQIQWQLLGSQAFVTDPELSKMLDITKEQQEELLTINRDHVGIMRKLREGGGNRQEVQRKRQELMKEYAGNLTDVLTKDQQEKFTKLKGKPFDVSLLPPGRRILGQ